MPRNASLQNHISRAFGLTRSRGARSSISP
jgi:hypothetical protein